MVGRLRMLMSTADCLERYGSKYRIAKAVQSGELRRISNGIYSEGARPREIEILLFKYPTSVVTMLSAYYYYNLTDVVPDKCHLAVERNGTKITDSSVVEYFVPAGTGAIGVENAVLRGIPLRIFGNGRFMRGLSNPVVAWLDVRTEDVVSGILTFLEKPSGSAP